MSKDFQRQDYMRSLRLGKRYSKPTWRAPKGIHSKMRLERTGYPKVVKIGYKQSREVANKIDGLVPILIHNLAELSQAKKTNAIIIARIGARKKLEIIKKAEEMKLKILNINKEKKQ